VVEIKGFRKGDAQLKAETMKQRWVPGVNALGKYGRWAFAEFRSVFDIKDDFAALVEGLAEEKAA
jgi:type III restriction enzyme